MKENLNEKCAPSKRFTHGSCFSVNQLKKITQKYNETKKKNLEINDNKDKLVKQLENELSGICKNQVCWTKQKFIKDMDDESINENTFRPEGAQKKYDWLNTTHINDVLSQYHDVYKDFTFLGCCSDRF